VTGLLKILGYRRPEIAANDCIAVETNPHEGQANHGNPKVFDAPEPIARSFLFDMGEFEMRISKATCVFSIAAVCTLLIGCPAHRANADEASTNKILMKLGHALAPDNHYQLTALEFAKAVKQKTNGKIEIQVFPQSQLGGEVQMTQALRTGTQDLMISSQAVIENTVKEWQVLSVPYLFDRADDACSARSCWEKAPRYVARPQYDRVGVALRA
jgi:hypothetical protein